MTTPIPAHDDLPELSYEQARDQLVEVVRTLESGGTSLAETMTLWERGEELATICQTWLDGARQRIDAAQRPASQQQDPDQSGQSPTDDQA